MSFASTSRGYAAQSYAKVGVETGVAAADSHRLILMLFDGALLAVARAGSAMEQKKVAEKGQIISHAIDIIANGLKASLNFAAGDELANRLAALYDYMCNRLLHANLNNDPVALNEVGRLLAELRSAWAEIAQDPAVVSASKAAV